MYRFVFVLGLAVSTSALAEDDFQLAAIEADYQQCIQGAETCTTLVSCWHIHQPRYLARLAELGREPKPRPSVTASIERSLPELAGERAESLCGQEER